MKILNQKNDHGNLCVTLRIEPHEFEKALLNAYLENTERYIVPGYAAGLAPRNKIEEIYGPTALFDEALDLCVPALYNQFLSDNNLRIIGSPQLTEVTWMEGGGASFTVTCDLYPEVKLGTYKGIQTTCKREDDEESFAANVLTQACVNMTADVPEGMILQKLNSMMAQEKLRIGQDPIYHVLADCIEILKKAYHETGVHRPKNQVDAEALDIMLQTVSMDNQKMTKEFFITLLKDLIQRYRSVPQNIDIILDELIEERNKQKSAMTPEEKTNEAYLAYLSSLELTEEQWHKQHYEQAADAARFDLLLNAVAKQENLIVTETDLHQVYSEIAQQCDLEIEEVLTAIDSRAVQEQLLRDKARYLILDNAVTIH